MIVGMIGGWEIPVIIGAAILLFGGTKIRDVARGLGAAKKEFMAGQVEAEVNMERERARARAEAEARAAEASKQGDQPTPPPAPPSTTVTPPVP